MNTTIKESPVTKEYYTTHEISRLLSVDFTTVIAWCEKGRLAFYKTPGGHRRVLPADLFIFAKKHGFPLPEELAREAPMKMLVVDDEDQVRTTVARMLKMTWPDAEIDTAKDGFEAGTKMARMRPDALVLDINLPGLDGFWVCRTVRTDPQLSHARILVISGEQDPDIGLRIRGAGADDFLPKPFELDELVSRLKALLAAPAREAK